MSIIDERSDAHAVHHGASASRSSELASLYENHWPMVVSYLRGQGASDPEDLASEVFVGVVRGLDGFEGDEAAFRAWVLVIAHRRLVDERRRYFRRPADATEPSHVAGLVDLETRGNVEDEALDRLATERVLAALDALTDDQRTVVLLHTVGDLSLRQISQLLGKRLPAVKSLHARGLAAAARIIGHPSRWHATGPVS